MNNNARQLVSLFLVLFVAITFAQNNSQEQDSIVKEISPKMDPLKRIDCL